MSFPTGGVASRPRRSRAGRRILQRLAPVTLIASLAVTGLTGPAPSTKPILEMRTHKLEAGTARVGFARSVHTDIPTELVGFDWDGKSRGNIELRVLSHGSWGPWTSLDGDPSEGPDVGSREWKNRTSAGPLYVGRGVRDIQVRVTDGSLFHLRMHTIRSEDPAPSPLSVPTAHADPGQPGIISRAQWGADESLRKCGPDYAPTVRNAIIHHTDTANNYSPSQTASIIRGIYAFHTQTNGWCDIGYNFLVDRYGQVFEGRYGGITSAVIGAHAGGFNTGSTGVSMIGTFSTAVPTGETYRAIETLLVWKLAYHGVDANRQIPVTAADFSGSRYPAGTVVNLWTISGHRDVDYTDCPGDAAYPIIPHLRVDVQRDIMNQIPWPLAGWHPAPSGPGVLALDGHGGLHPQGSQPAVSHSAIWPDFNIARGMFRQGGGGFVVDGWGGVHPYGGAPLVSISAYWNGWDIARGIAPGPSPNTGYVLDGWGGVHPFGGAPNAVFSAYWQGWDIARGIVTGGLHTSGYVLDGWGGVHPFGGATPVSVSAYWQGWDIARGIALRSDGTSGYVLDGYGGIHPFGGAPNLGTSAYWQGWDIARGIVLTNDGGGYVVDGWGGVHQFGNAPAVSNSLTWFGQDLGRGIG